MCDLNGKPCECKKCDCTYLFVYGSLKRGGKLHPALVKHQKLSFSMVPGTLIKGARLYDLGEFPGVVLLEDEKEKVDNNVRGEIVKISSDSLAYFDYIESSLYTRQTLDVLGEDNVIYPCEVYIVNTYATSFYRLREASYIVTGDWKV